MNLGGSRSLGLWIMRAGEVLEGMNSFMVAGLQFFKRKGDKDCDH